MLIIFVVGICVVLLLMSWGHACFFIYILMTSLTWLLQLEKCRRLVQIAEKSLEEGTCYFYGIEACNEVLDGHGRVIGPTLRHECLCIRAALLLKVS